jgi:hypothetical protein
VPLEGHSRSISFGTTFVSPSRFLFLAYSKKNSSSKKLVEAMSAQGQTEKNSVRAYVFRFALELGHCSKQSACLKGANISRRDCF